MNTQSIETLRSISDDHRIIIGKFFLIVKKHIAAPSISILLYTDNVRVLSKQIVANILKAVFVFVVASISTDIIGYNLQRPLRNILTSINGQINTNRNVCQQETTHGNPHHTPLENQPKEDEQEVYQQEDRQRHTQRRKQRMVRRIQTVAIAYQ